MLPHQVVTRLHARNDYIAYAAHLPFPSCSNPVLLQTAICANRMQRNHEIEEERIIYAHCGKC